MSSILVTGGAGYIGSHMVHALVESGESVVVLDNLSTGFKWAIPKGVELVIGETGDHALVPRLITEREVSAIIHFAASIVVPDSMSDPLGYYRNNTVSSRALIECAVRGGVRHFIFPPQRQCTAIRSRYRLARMMCRRRCRPTAPRSL